MRNRIGRPLPFSFWLGDEPDLNRLLRREPVRRDEVRIYRPTFTNARWRVTMPLGTYRVDHGDFVAEPTLWQPLMDELAAKNRPFPLLQISVACEYLCLQCGTRFLAHELPGTMARICSDKCGEERRIKLQQALIAKRGQQRAEARAGRVCEYCGTAIEAARSTRRFCSDLCRVRHHHHQRG
jgi:hypothetical protein